MKADLSGQVRQLMEDGLRPVTMTDIKNRAPVRMTLLQRAVARSRHVYSRRILATRGLSASRYTPGINSGDRPRRARPAMLGAATGMAGLAVIAIIISITSSATPIRPAVDQGAVRLLAKVAENAARQPAPRVRDGQYMYVETRAAVPSKPSEWDGKPAAGTGLRDKAQPFPRHIHLKLVTDRVWVPVGSACRTGSFWHGAGCPSIGSLNDPTYRLLQTLPTNPRTLLAMIYRAERGHGPGPSEEAFVTIDDLLRNTIAPPRVTAALYRATALIPGVTLVPEAQDAIGRHGVAVARVGPGVDGGVRDELIFSRNTLQLIGERTVIARTGETTSASAIIARTFVDRRGQVP